MKNPLVQIIKKDWEGKRRLLRSAGVEFYERLSGSGNFITYTYAQTTKKGNYYAFIVSKTSYGPDQDFWEVEAYFDVGGLGGNFVKEKKFKTKAAATTYAIRRIIKTLKAEKYTRPKGAVYYDPFEYEKNPGKYLHETVRHKRQFDPRSFRTVSVGKRGKGKKAVIGCPRGKWSPKKKRCKEGMKTQKLLFPRTQAAMKKNPLSKKYYQKIAEIINQFSEDPDIINRQGFIEAMAEFFAADNPRFSYRQFKMATRFPFNPGDYCVNPGSKAQALKTFKKWHGYNPSGAKKIKINPVPSYLVNLGDLRGVIYESDKGNPGRAQKYIHKFKKPFPKLTADPAGKNLFIIGGGYRIATK